MKFEKRINVEKEEILKLSQETKLDPLVVELLLMRGITTKDDIDKFLNTDIKNLSSPLALSGIAEAEQIIKSVITKNQAIVIYGDYDCDGIGAIAILYLTLKDMGAKVHSYIPQRHEEGYGLHLESLDKIKSDFDAKLIITVDCGISAIKEVEYCKQSGIDIIITDHHEPGDKLPDTLIINPKLDKENNPLCGAGVALKLSEQLMGREYASKFMDICAISTVADVVPLVGDNRIIVKYGLEMLSKGQCCEGLKKLITSCGIKKGKKLKTSDIGYRIAPRLNATGRLSSASKSLQLLIEDDATAIAMLTEEIERENKTRQDILADVFIDTLAQLESYDMSRNLIIVLKSAEWEEGVVGIAAAKTSEQFYRPTILFTTKDGIAKGSARSISGINIYEVIKSCEDILIKFGGHAMAAGMSLEVKNFDEFLRRTNEYIKKNTKNECFEKRIVYDQELVCSDVNKKLINEILKLAPFGCKNPKPVFISKDNKIDFKQIGNYPHIKCRKKYCEMLAFNKLYALPALNSDAEKILSFYIDKEIFKNREFIQCKLRDIFVKEAKIDNEILFYKYIENFVLKGESQPQTKIEPLDDFHFGILYVCFSNDCFNEFVEENPKLQKFFFNSTIMNPYNAIVISPNNEFVYTYYNKIIFLEKPPLAMINNIRESFSGIIEVVGNEPLFNEITINHTYEKLRSDYVFFAKILNEQMFNSSQSLYKKAVFYGYMGLFSEFCLSLYIFNELELLLINKSGIIEIYNKKTDLNDSKIIEWYKKREGN